MPRILSTEYLSPIEVAEYTSHMTSMCNYVKDTGVLYGVVRSIFLEQEHSSMYITASIRLVFIEDYTLAMNNNEEEFIKKFSGIVSYNRMLATTPLDYKILIKQDYNKIMSIAEAWNRFEAFSRCQGFITGEKLPSLRSTLLISSFPINLDKILLRHETSASSSYIRIFNKNTKKHQHLLDAMSTLNSVKQFVKTGIIG